LSLAASVTRYYLKTPHAIDAMSGVPRRLLARLAGSAAPNAAPNARPPIGPADWGHLPCATLQGYRGRGKTYEVRYGVVRKDLVS